MDSNPISSIRTMQSDHQYTHTHTHMHHESGFFPRIRLSVFALPLRFIVFQYHKSTWSRLSHLYLYRSYLAHLTATVLPPPRLMYVHSHAFSTARIHAALPTLAFILPDVGSRVSRKSTGTGCFFLLYTVDEESVRARVYVVAACQRILRHVSWCW